MPAKETLPLLEDEAAEDVLAAAEEAAEVVLAAATTTEDEVELLSACVTAETAEEVVTVAEELDRVSVTVVVHEELDATDKALDACGLEYPEMAVPVAVGAAGEVPLVVGYGAPLAEVGPTVAEPAPETHW
jgi:hypothetical protein